MIKPTIEKRDMIFTGKVTFTRGINLDMVNDADHALRITSASRSHYPIISWYNKAKQFMYGIVAHEVTHEGITHNHASEYFADETAKNKKRGKLDKQFGKQNSTFSLEGVTLLAKKDGAIALTDSITGKAYKLIVRNGILDIAALDKAELLSAGSLPTVEKTEI